MRWLHAPLTRMARIYVPNALADEVVQETWLAVIGSIDTFEQRASLKSWVYRIMLNRVRRLARREAKVVPFASTGHGGDAQPAIEPQRLGHPELGPQYWPAAPSRWDELPDDHLTSEETLRFVRASIDKLPDAQREVVVLRDVEGWTSTEVCDALGISSVNQRVLLHRGRTAIRSMLEAHLDG